MPCTKLFDTTYLKFSERRKTVTVEEKSRKYVAENTSGKMVCLFHVDGGLIKEGQRCDYMMVTPEETSTYFIELKGQDLLHAIRQINQTIDHSTLKPVRKYKLHGRIILSRANTPDLKSTELIKLERKLKESGGDLIKKVNQLTEKI